ncbi:hypothetical protein LMG28138_01253 [Pararobbsia alpina]|uniref:Uncharacterized protein n=1 Tax=Pararobbsia alpina TaxID=621374 RepID=A0A6S7CJN0_9BURK|nr:hypothetical protein LMG28138_01253 [Pararobbsia alpina]
MTPQAPEPFIVTRIQYKSPFPEMMTRCPATASGLFVAFGQIGPSGPSGRPAKRPGGRHPVFVQ